MKEDRRSYVYAYIRPIDDEIASAGTPFYIGEGVGDRINQKHKRENESFELPPREYRIKIAEGLSKQEALDLEEHFIKLYGRISNETGILVNIAPKGTSTLGMIHSEESKNKMSERRKGIHCGIEHWRSSPVITLRPNHETGVLIKEEFISITEASRKLEIRISDLSQVARGERRNAKGVKIYFKQDWIEGRRPCDEIKRRTHIICLSPEGKYIWTDNLNALAEKEGFSQSAAYNCVTGDAKTCEKWQFWEEQNWALIFPLIKPGHVVVEEGIQNAIKASQRSYCLRDPLGNIHEGENLSKFCNDNGLLLSAIHNLLSGRSNTSEGWTRGNEPPPRPQIWLRSPEGEKVLVQPSKAVFARKHELDGSTLSKVIRGKLKYTKGWSLWKEDV